MPSSVTYGILIRHLYLSGVWLLWVQNGHQNDSGLCAQNMVIILGSKAQRNWGKLYDRLMSMGMFTLILNKLFT